MKKVKIEMGKRGKGIRRIWMNERELKSLFGEVWNKVEKVLGVDIGKGLDI